MFKANTIVQIVRTRKGLRTPAMSNHLLFTGPPGVGKTETGRAVAKTLCGLGVLPEPDVKETSKEALAGQYVGEVETHTRDFLAGAIGATVFFDEFGDLLHGGYAGGDPIGQAIIGCIVPWMENNRDKAVFIAAGYAGACRKVIESNAGLQGRFATTIAFESYAPDMLLEITASIIKHSDSTVAPGALQRVLLEPFTRFYNKYEVTAEGDLIRDIDKLNNGRFARNIVEKATGIRNLRIMDRFGLDAIDISDPSIGADIPDDAVTLLTEEDLYTGLQQTIPPDFRTNV